MLLSYLTSPFSGGDERKTVKATITTNHPASSYGQPVIVLPDGDALDLMSWVGCGYVVVKATPTEVDLLNKLFSNIALSARMSEIGKKGGSAKSSKKAASSAANGAKGGRPRKPNPE